jgi:hypothetical protein
MTARISTTNWSLRCSLDAAVEGNTVAGTLDAEITAPAKRRSMEIFRNIDIFLMQRGFNCRAYSRGLFYFLEGVRLLKPGKPILGEAD